jgi:hypothetical protein
MGATVMGATVMGAISRGSTGTMGATGTGRGALVVEPNMVCLR